MSDVSWRELRDRTADVLRRVEAGERIVISVNDKPVAELVPVGRQQWMSGAAVARILAESPADRALIDDLTFVRDQMIQPL